MAAALQLLLLRSISRFMKLREPLLAALSDAGDQALLKALNAAIENAPPLDHGHMPKWSAAIEKLSSLAATGPASDATALSFDISTANLQSLSESLETFIPWRKGPFVVGDIALDTEWRCDLKWARLQSALDNLSDRLVLDVGSGNGYFSMRAALNGARAVVGIDPTALYVMQFRALAAMGLTLPVDVLPLPMEALEVPPVFDTVLSMGVIYHRRSPVDHLRECRDVLRPGGQLILETLVTPGDENTVLTPSDRYARMRNVWFLPSAKAACRWLERTGFVDVEICDETPTTEEEQRPTDWMPFESLSASLDPDDPRLTVEGYPSPRRAILKAQRKATAQK